MSSLVVGTAFGLTIACCKTCPQTSIFPSLFTSSSDTHHAPQVTKNSTTFVFHTEVFAEQLFPSHEEEEEDGEDDGRRDDESVRAEYKERAHRIIRREKR